MTISTVINYDNFTEERCYEIPESMFAIIKYSGDKE